MTQGLSRLGLRKRRISSAAFVGQGVGGETEMGLRLPRPNRERRSGAIIRPYPAQAEGGGDRAQSGYSRDNDERRERPLVNFSAE